MRSCAPPFQSGHWLVNPRRPVHALSFSENIILSYGARMTVFVVFGGRIEITTDVSNGLIRPRSHVHTLVRICAHTHDVDGIPARRRGYRTHTPRPRSCDSAESDEPIPIYIYILSSLLHVQTKRSEMILRYHKSHTGA